MTADPAERRPDESHRAFARFCLYRAQPAHRRNLSEVARLCRVSRQAIHQTATRHEWDKRLSPDDWLSRFAYGGRNPILDLMRQKAASSESLEDSLAPVDLEKATADLHELSIALEATDPFAGLDLSDPWSPPEQPNP